MSKPAFDPGFTEQYRGGLRRVINPDGQFNVHRRGTTWRDVHPYLYMLNAKWRVFMGMILAGYLALNLMFAVLYYYGVGMEHLRGSDAATPFTRFLNAFFFSAHTLTTVGYGNIWPDGVMANSVAALEALLGLLAFAVATGLVFGRFSRPAARIAFSRQMVVAPYQEGAALQFRIANRRSNNLMELEARVLMMTVERSDGGRVRKYAALELERRNVQFLPLAWTVVHPITESSPLWRKTAQDLARLEAEFLIMIKAFDDTFFQTVYVRYSYRYEELVWGARFATTFEVDEHGHMVLDLARLSEVVPSSAGGPKPALIQG
ncbi:MAG TPA: ion channel [Terriglobia bacterium]|jgi:inward rectifier potassium channel|nr:ion channel [Terriglobia bacterium]